MLASVQSAVTGGGKKCNSHIPQCNHANGLPDAQPNPRCDPPIQTLDSVIRIDIPQRLPHGQVLRPIRVHGFGLHLHAYNLDRLIPRTQPTTKPTRKDLLQRAQFLPFLLPRRLPDATLRQSTQPETAPPVRRLPYRHRVHPFVDPPYPLLPVNIHERLERPRRLDPGGRDLVLRDLHRLHAGAEAHCGVGLRDAAGHAAGDAGDEVGRAERARVVFGFGGDKEEHGAFGAGFDPGPGNEALVVCWEGEGG